MRFLCLSDIHGHAAALAAVLATAERRGYSRILVAGDICFPGPQPLETWRRLSQLRAICVQGVGDRAIAMIDPEGLNPRDEFERARYQRLLSVREELGEQILTKLAKLPQVARQTLPDGSHLALVHGSPLDPLEPITHDMDDHTIVHLLGEETASVVLCGGSHVPFDRVVPRRGDVPGMPEKTRVINVGSVGEAPGSARVERPVSQASLSEGAGIGTAALGESRAYLDPRFAHATFVEATDGGIEVEQFVVPLGRAA